MLYEADAELVMKKWSMTPGVIRIFSFVKFLTTGAVIFAVSVFFICEMKYTKFIDGCTAEQLS